MMAKSEGHRRWAGRELFSTGEAAEICRVSQQTIIRHFDTGRLRGHRVPGSRFRRIPRGELIRFLRENDIRTDALEEQALRILVVDDDPSFIEPLRRRVGHADHVRWRLATSGFGAGLITERFEPHIVLLEPRLPEVDGPLVCRELKAGGARTAPLVVIVSEDVDPDDAERLLDAGADELVRKSRDLDALVARIERELPV
ncbi:MAG: response regulator [Planctomycetes bacterium]|nr:response regulator [Planctomycetota bacterium]